MAGILGIISGAFDLGLGFYKIESNHDYAIALGPHAVFYRGQMWGAVIKSARSVFKTGSAVSKLQEKKAGKEMKDL